MGDNVINLNEYFREQWKEVFACDGPNSTLQVYVNDKTGEAEVVQMNDDNEAIRTTLSGIDAKLLVAALSMNKEKATK